MQKQYTEALELYETYWKQEAKNSPQRLLRMAFIAEGLGDYAKVLLYLSQYNYIENSTAVLLKMERIAQEYKLKGYEYDDLAAISAFYFRNILFFYSLFFGLILFFFIFIVLRISKGKRLKPMFFIIFWLFLSLYSGFIYWIQPSPKVIIQKEHTYLMQAPSAAAAVLKVVAKGHKLAWKGSQDIWLKVEWDNQIAFVKSTDVWLLDF